MHVHHLLLMPVRAMARQASACRAGARFDLRQVGACTASTHGTRLRRGAFARRHREEEDMASATKTTDHDAIRKWAEDRGGKQSRFNKLVSRSNEDG